jgi:16S rRNA A1518/A1519 N6-dimethyltransferase RsmA/KsgA/DIM1 with predicted DNA glycosylase/AP lyase activity
MLYSPPFTTNTEDIDALFLKIQLSNKDSFIDLGCGDGRVVEIAAKHGALATGVERDTRLLSKCKQQDNVCFIDGDMFSIDLHPYSVIYLYLSTLVSEEFLPKFKTLRAKTIISNNHCFSSLGLSEKYLINKTTFYLYRI